MQTSMQTDDLLQLQEPVATAGAIRAVNGFNGRLLTGADLTRLQEARRTGDRHLGLALGDGVAFGLDVVQHPDLSSAATPVLRVAPGLAVNRLGQGLRLERETAVALTRRFETPVPATLFEPCNPIAVGTYVAGAGVYVLTVAPASLPEGRAPSNGLDPAAVRCNIDATVEALQFRLLTVAAKHYTDVGPGSAQFRNRLAYRCFGVPEDDAALRAPLAAEKAPAGLPLILGEAGLDAAEVPLALLYWTADGLQFIDLWAVRRPLHRREHASAGSLGERGERRARGEAMCNQFAQHIAELVAASANAASLGATAHFRWLPPFGLVPLQGTSRSGVGEETFFSGLVRAPRPWLATRRRFIDARQLAPMRELALEHRPIDTNAAELILVYRPWQNHAAAAADPTIQPVAVFASGLLPETARARFDLARADYSNLANCCDAP